MSDDDFTILAIDPGLTGAMAFYKPHFPTCVEVFDMPEVDSRVDPHSLMRTIRDRSPTVAIIEHVWPMPKDGVRQAWRFSAAYTTACVVCALLNLPTSMVAPVRWKKSFSLPGGPEGKEKARALALQLFPLSAALFARKKDQGRAEAALLAYYAAEKFIVNGGKYQLPLS